MTSFCLIVQGDRDLFLRSGQQLVGREAAQEAHPFHRALGRLASEQCAARCGKWGHEGPRVFRLHQGRRQKVRLA